MTPSHIYHSQYDAVTYLPKSTFRPRVEKPSSADIAMFGDEHLLFSAIYPALGELILIVLYKRTANKQQETYITSSRMRSLTVASRPRPSEYIHSVDLDRQNAFIQSFML